MINPLSSTRIYLCIQPCDMRLGFNGLFSLASNYLNIDPYSGSLFLFTNKKRNRLKILYFDGQGLWVLARRQEKGTLHWPLSAGDNPHHLELSIQAFHLLLGGIDLKDGCSSALKEIAYLRDEAHIKQIYIKKLEESRTYLEEQLTLLKQAYYGKRSERHYDPNQGMLFDQETLDGMGVGQETEPVPEEEEPKPTRKPRGRKKRGIQSQRPLPVVEETLIPEVVQKSPDAWKKIGQNVTDILEHVP